MKRVAMWFAVVNLLLLACAAPKTTPPSNVQSPSLVIKLSLEELVAQAGWIVVGIVSSQKSQWNAEHSQIHTLVTVTVEEWVKGEPRGNEIIIKIPGGQVGEVSQMVGGSPNFRIGEKVLVFLQIQDDDTISVVGGTQGKLVIENNKIVGSDVSLAELIKQIKAQSNKSSR
jgi:hypothetical protein